MMHAAQADAPTLLTADEVCARLRISRRTLYSLPFFRQRKTRVGKRGVRWTPEVVRLYIEINSTVARAG